MNRRLRQWGRYAPREPETKPVPPPMEPPPDTSWVTFEPISQARKPRKGRHRRQR